MEKTTECKKCGKSISIYILSIQNKPDSTEWVRNGFCSHSCFAEFAESNQKPIVAEVIKKPNVTKKKTTRKKKVKILAFLIEGRAGGLPGFRGGIILGASQLDWEKKIRKDTHCPGAEVKIIQPKEWGPPKLRLFSQDEIYDKSPAIYKAIVRYITRNDIEIELSNLENHGKGTILNPVSGKAFFLYKY